MGRRHENQQTFTVEENKELRFEINDSSDPVTIELIDGTAEIFGVEMIVNKIYSFSSSFSVVTLQGCELKLLGKVSRSYCVDRKNGIYNLHSFLEEYRLHAEKNCVKGPVTLLAGPTDVGKSTLCRSLLNYAARQGRTPLFIDLDVGQSSVSVPGTISIVPINEPEDIVKGFNESNLCVYYFGYKSPGFNILLYYLLIQRLGKTLRFRIENSRDTAISGAIIDTCGWVDGQGYKAILFAAESFDINTVIVLADTKLYSRLKQDLSPNVEIKFISMLDGVIKRNQSTRRQNRDNLIYHYFYGSQFSIKPYIFEIKFSDVEVFRVSSPKHKVDLHMVDNAHQYISLIPVDISPALSNHVLALSHADAIEEDIILTSVLGFIHIQNVDMDQKLLSILSPQPRPLPRKFLMMGDIQLEIENS